MRGEQYSINSLIETAGVWLGGNTATVKDLAP